ncbi:MAG: phosphatase PAP2 family protein [Marinifilaceae bacterium]|jgi:undecaprenyl-diphosphatase|nr:phosphatase PAP2 family protein [Marinifilaceae bacterium]
MLQYLIDLDKDILLALNGVNNPFWDNFMYLISQKFIWIFLYISIVLTIFRNFHWKKSLIVLLCIGLVILIADQLCSGLMKPFFERFRPSRDPQFSHLVNTVYDYTGGKYGFASSHAGNTFGLACFISLLFRDRVNTVFMFSWAILVSYSRIYLGVHYLGDILVGALIGIFAGYLVYRLMNHFVKDDKFQNNELNENIISQNLVSIIGCSQILLLLFVFVK